MLNLVLWGTGRWALNYISAIDNISKSINIKLFIITSRQTLNLVIYSKNLDLRVASLEGEIKSALEASQYGLIVNENRKHDKVVADCASYNLHLLCEKPLMLTSATLSKIHKKAFTETNFRFWESMLPLYCSYFYSLQQSSAIATHYKLVWHDMSYENSNDGNKGKTHDYSIEYYLDIIPHACSIIRAIIPTAAKYTITKVSSSLNEACFNVLSGCHTLNVFCNRNTAKRRRVLSAFYQNKKLFDYDFSIEPGYFIYIDQSIQTLGLQVPKKGIMMARPIEKQLLDFLGIDKKMAHSNRHNISYHQYVV